MTASDSSPAQVEPQHASVQAALDSLAAKPKPAEELTVDPIFGQPGYFTALAASQDHRTPRYTN